MVRYIEEDNEEDFVTIKETLPIASLTLLVGDRLSHSFPLKGVVQVGRDKSNAIVAADQKVSRHHATLTPVDNTYIISDKGSANGTYVNGVRISQPTRLRDKDRLTLGDTTFLFSTTQPEVSVDVDGDKPNPPVSFLPVIRNLPLTINEDNKRIWFIIGCMAAVIIILLVIVALLLGIFMGRSQVEALLLVSLL